MNMFPDLNPFMTYINKIYIHDEVMTYINKIYIHDINQTKIKKLSCGGLFL